MSLIYYILFFTLLYSYTEINENFFSGTDTLYAINSPYVSNQTIAIYPDATVFIEDGVTWKFHSNSELRVLGTLQTAGNSDRNISFKSYDPEYQWLGIFLDESTNSIIQY